MRSPSPPPLSLGPSLPSSPLFVSFHLRLHHLRYRPQSRPLFKLTRALVVKQPEHCGTQTGDLRQVGFEWEIGTLRQKEISDLSFGVRGARTCVLGVGKSIRAPLAGEKSNGMNLWGSRGLNRRPGDRRGSWRTAGKAHGHDRAAADGGRFPQSCRSGRRCNFYCLIHGPPRSRRCRPLGLHLCWYLHRRGHAHRHAPHLRPPG